MDKGRQALQDELIAEEQRHAKTKATMDRYHAALECALQSGFIPDDSQTMADINTLLTVKSAD